MLSAGANGKYRLVLGYHSSGKGSLEVYSRDILAVPLRIFEETLRQIRIGSFQPDKIRSGIIQQPNKEDCRRATSEVKQSKEVAVASNNNEQHLSSSSSSSDASTENEDSEDGTHAAHWTQMTSDLGHKRSWVSGTMHQYLISKMGYFVAGMSCFKKAWQRVKDKQAEYTYSTRSELELFQAMRRRALAFDLQKHHRCRWSTFVSWYG